MTDFKKVNLTQLAVYLSDVYSKLENKWCSQDVNDWLDDIREFENNANETDNNFYVYDNIIYNKQGESERLTIGFKYIYFDDGTVDIEYYLPKNVNI